MNMQHAWWISYNNNIILPAVPPPNRRVVVAMTDQIERVERMASARAVVIFSMSTCYMCHAVKRLFSGLGVNLTVHEIDEDPRGEELEKALSWLLGRPAAVPAVFIGGKMVGAMDNVLCSHINGTLVPLLKQAGALWL